MTTGGGYLRNAQSQEYFSSKQTAGLFFISTPPILPSFMSPRHHTVFNGRSMAETPTPCARRCWQHGRHRREAPRAIISCRQLGAHGRPPQPPPPPPPRCPCSSAWSGAGSPWAPTPSAPAPSSHTPHTGISKKPPHGRTPTHRPAFTTDGHHHQRPNAERTSWPSSVMRTSSSMRIPMPRYLPGARSFRTGAGGMYTPGSIVMTCTCMDMDNHEN